MRVNAMKSTTAAGVEVAPLSFQQEEMLRNIQRHPDCAHRYDMVCLFRLDGETDRECLVQAIGDVVARHGALRTVVGDSAEAGHAQHVRPTATAPVTVRSWADVSVEGVKRALVAERHGADEVLAGRPLFRPALHELDHTLLLSFTIHHFVYDGLSLPVLWRDLSECYAARFDGRATVLPALAATYTDFAREQRESWSRTANDSLAFWKEVTAGCPEKVHWPTPTGGSEVSPRQEMVKVPFSLSAPTVSAVRTAARSARVSPFMILLCATAVGIARTTGQHDVLLGTDTANREDPRKRDMVGMYVNSRLSRVRVTPGENFLETVRSVWRTWIAAEEYRDVYSDQILQGLGGLRMMKVNMYNIPDRGYETPTFPDVEVTALPVRVGSPDWRDLHVIWEEDGDRVNALVQHHPARVDRATADALIGHVTDLLEAPDRVI